MASGLRLKDLLTLLDDIADRNLAEDWDNVGLMVGDPTAEVSGIMVALDPTAAVLTEADRSGCNTLVTHHPLIFKPLKGLRLDEPEGRVLGQVIRAGMAVVACHTNLDKIHGGVSDLLAAALGLSSARPLIPDPPDLRLQPCGLGRIGELEAPLAFSEFVELVKSRLDIAHLPVAGPSPDKITTVAVCGGSGSELAVRAREAGAQVYLTGEIKHSMARWAEEAGFCLIDAGHYATEQPVVAGLAEILRRRLADHGSAVKVLTTAAQVGPFRSY